MCIISLLGLVCEHIDYLHVWHHKLKSRHITTSCEFVNDVPTAYAVNQKISEAVTAIDGPRTKKSGSGFKETEKFEKKSKSNMVGRADA